MVLLFHNEKPNLKQRWLCEKARKRENKRFNFLYNSDPRRAKTIHRRQNTYCCQQSLATKNWVY